MAEENADVVRTQAMEAAKLLGTYGKWVVALEVGTIAAVKPLGLLEAGVTTFVLAALAVVACAFAVLQGIFLMLALPSITQRLHRAPDEDIFDKKDPDLGNTPLRKYTHRNFWGFMVGITLFSLAVLSTFQFTWDGNKMTIGKAVDALPKKLMASKK